MFFLYRYTIMFSYAVGISFIILSTQYNILTRYFIEPIIILTCFIIMGLVTSDFLSPSLSNISNEFLNISPKISGMTLLALGNALPDIISAYQSMSTGSTSLTMGQLLGATFFVITVVIGAMGITKSILLTKVVQSESVNDEQVTNPNSDTESKEINSNIILYDRNRYLHYILPFSALILWTLYIISDAKITFYNAVSFITLYILFMIFQIYEESIHNFYSNLTTVNTHGSYSSLYIDNRAIAASHSHVSLENFANDPRFTKEEVQHQIQDYMRHTYNGWVRMSLRDYIDILDSSIKLNDINAGFDHIDDSTSSINGQILSEETPLINNELRVNQSAEIVSTNNFPELNESSILSPELLDNSGKLQVPHAQKQSHIRSSSIPSAPSIPCSISPISSMVINDRFSVMSLHPDHFCGLELFEKLLYPTVEMSFFEVLILMFTAPSSLLIHMIIPTFSNYGIDFELPIYKTLQLSMAPIIICLGITNSLSISIILSSCTFSLFLFVLIYSKTISNIKHLSSGFTFILSLIIISTAVKLNLQILTSWAAEYNLSGTILGLTVYAWGNSVGDLISNVMFVQVGIFDVALSACFGSPLLYFVCGLGLNTLIILTERHQKSALGFFHSYLDFEPDSHFKVTAIGTILAIFVLSVLVPINNWKIDYKISIVLFSIYASVTLINIYIEL